MGFNVNEEDAADARHDTPPNHVDYTVPRPGVLTPEEFRAARWGEPEPDPDRPLGTAQKLIESAPQGLTFKADNGVTFLDIGRNMERATGGMHTLDLRVLLAHLDSAATAITAELQARGQHR